MELDVRFTLRDATPEEKAEDARRAQRKHEFETAIESYDSGCSVP